MPPIESIVFVMAFTILGASFLIVGKKRYSSFVNPVTLFSVLWAIVGVGSNLCLYGYYPPSIYVNCLIFVSVIVFGVVSMALPGGDTGFAVSSEDLCGCAAVRTKSIILVNLICIAFMLPVLIKAVGIIASDGWSMLRLANYNEDINERFGFMSRIRTYLQLYVVKPCGTATLILSLWMMTARAPRAKTVFVLGVFQVVMDVMITAGRSSVVSALFYAVTVLLFSGSAGSIAVLLKRVLKLRILLPLLAAVALVLAVTSGRSGAEGAGFVQTAYQYYFSGPGFLTQLLAQDRPGFSVDEDFMLGWATFGWLVNIPLTIGLVLGFGTTTSVQLIGSYLTSGNLLVGDGREINAMCTVFYDFLLDWGTAGVVIGSVLLALASMLVFCKFKQDKSIFWGCVATYWAYVLFRTVFRWDPVDFVFTVVLLMMYLFTHGAKKGEPSRRRGTVAAKSSGWRQRLLKT